MKYACLVYIDAAAIGAITPEEDRKLIDDTIAEDWELRNRGHLILAQPLQPPETAVTVRIRNGKLSTTDGPFAETKEHLGGFSLIVARDLNEAIQIASKSAILKYGSIEIRPFLEQSHSETGQKRPELQV
jgi:hypothetical protein